MSSVEPVILWQPTEVEVQESNLGRYMRWLEQREGLCFDDYAQLHAWSIANLDTFWGTIWDYTGVLAAQPYTRVLGRRALPGSEWFPGAKLNFAENLLQHALHGDPARLALVAYSETRPRQTYTYAELLDQVGAFEAFLRRSGIQAGDRVAGVVANAPEALVAMLACASLGAIWSSASPDFGTDGLFDRFSQIEPKLLVAVNGYGYGGKTFLRAEQIAALQARIPSVQRVVVIDNLPGAPHPEGPEFIGWETALSSGAGERPSFTPQDFDHPLYILYSSGTTGTPKCIVHGAGGVLLQHAKELILHADLRADDIFFYFTTCGWMMWNWFVSGLLTGARLIMFDGNPAYPGINMLWRMAETEGVTHFGTSARFLGSCRSAGIRPGSDHDLRSLRVLLSTGSPLLPEDYDWVYESVKQNVLLGSIAGGTDIVSCFVGVSPILPVRRGEIQCKMLGVDVRAFDDAGRDVIGERGELVCVQPLPSMPVGFWNDPSMAKYRASYFETYEGVWAHGDYIMFNAQGGCVIYGRSDATLNPGGVRIGTAEIYRLVETLPEIADSLVVGQSWQDDIRVVLLVTVKEEHALTEALKSRIRQRIREGASPRHVPAVICQVSQIPYTRSGKKVEIAVAKLLRGEPVTNREALVNPSSLDEIAELAELRDPVMHPA